MKLVKMNGGGATIFTGGHRGEFLPDADGNVMVPESMVGIAEAQGFQIVPDEDAPAEAPAAEVPTPDAITEPDADKTALELAGDLTKNAPPIEPGDLGEGTDAERAEMADLASLTAAGQADYADARTAGLSHAEAMVLVADQRTAPVGG